MRHDERLQLARVVCRKLADHEGNRFRFAGVIGSTARDDDEELSDLDLIGVLSDDSALWDFHFLYRGCAVGATIYHESALRQCLTPSRNWPETMGVLDALCVLEGDASAARRWMELGLSHSTEVFRQALVQVLPALVFESHNRLLCCQSRKDDGPARASAIEVLKEMQVVLCLLNRQWVWHDYLQGIQDTFDFPLLPAQWRELAPALWNAAGLDRIVDLSKLLVRNYLGLLEQHGLLPPDRQQPDDLAL